MKFSGRILTAATIAAFSLGCDAEPVATAAASTGPAPAPTVLITQQPVVTGAATDVGQSLAMNDPGGSAPVDVEVRAAQEWVRRVPGSTDKLVDLGRAWIAKARQANETGFYAHAKATAELVLARDPENHMARELLAQVRINTHAFEEALALCEEVLAKDAESLVALAIKSDALYELGRNNEAITTADKLLELKPNLASYTRAAFFQWLRGDLPEALKSSKFAIEASNDPAKPEPRAYALVQTANFFFHKGDYDGADEGYKQALKLVSDYPTALVGRGRVATAKGEPKRAVEFLSVAFKAAPHADTAWRLGDARAASGDEAGAAEAYGKVSEIGKDDDKRTVSLYLSTKNLQSEQALALANAEMKIRPGVYTQDALAWALYRNGKFEEAKAASDKATKLGTKDALLIYHAGAIDIALGKVDEGKAKIKQALELNPQFDPTAAVEAKVLLEKE